MPAAHPPAAVLFDRDGTLVRDVPYNGDPVRVEPMPGFVPGRSTSAIIAEARARA